MQLILKLFFIILTTIAIIITSLPIYGSTDDLIHNPVVKATTESRKELNEELLRLNANDNKSAEKVLILSPGTWRVPSNLSIPANVTLEIKKDAFISLDSGVTLIINGKLVAPLNLIFSGAGNVAFSRSAVKEVYPQWWGAIGDGVNNDAPAIQKSLNSANEIFIPKTEKYYLIARDNMISIPGNSTIKSDGAILYKPSHQKIDQILYIDGKSNIVIDGISLQASALDRIDPEWHNNTSNVLGIHAYNGASNITVINSHSKFLGGFGKFDKNSSNITVRHCTASDTVAPIFVGGHSRNVSITDCSFGQPSSSEYATSGYNHHFYIEGIEGGTFTSLDLYGGNGYSFHFWSGRGFFSMNITISDASLHDFAGEFGYFKGAKDVAISNVSTRNRAAKTTRSFLTINKSTNIRFDRADFIIAGSYSPVMNLLESDHITFSNSKIDITDYSGSPSLFVLTAGPDLIPSNYSFTNVKFINCGTVFYAIDPGVDAITLYLNSCKFLISRSGGTDSVLKMIHYKEIVVDKCDFEKVSGIKPSDTPKYIISVYTARHFTIRNSVVNNFTSIIGEDPFKKGDLLDNKLLRD